MVLQMMKEDNGMEPPGMNAGAGAVERIGHAFIESRGRRTEAAKILGISRSTLWRRVKSFGLSSSGRF